MNKQLIPILSIFLLSASCKVSAAEITKTFNSFGINVSTQSAVNTQRAAKTIVNKTATKAQISSIKSKINSASSAYQSSVESLANNLLPTEQLKKYNEEKSKIKNAALTQQEVNNEIAKDGTVRLNKILKSSASQDTFKNLNTAQKAVVKKDFNSLKNVSYSYSQIIEQSKILTKQIKADTTAALELKSDITDLTKTQLSVTKQAKCVTKLIDNLIISASKAGVSL